MARTARFIVPGSPHHILNRGNNKERIFLDEGDYSFFLSQVRKYKRKFPVRIYHYCLMPNHYHFLIEPPDKETLVGFMHSSMVVYAQYVQRKYDRVGHIWQERYKSPVIQTERYLAHCGYYIEDNPRRAGLVKDLRDWPWSSYRFYAHGRPDSVVDADPNYSALGGTDRERQENYRIHIMMAEDEGWLDGVRVGLGQGAFGSQDFVRYMMETFKLRLVRQRGRPQKP